MGAILVRQADDSDRPCAQAVIGRVGLKLAKCSVVQSRQLAGMPGELSAFCRAAILAARDSLPARELRFLSDFPRFRQYSMKALLDTARRGTPTGGRWATR